MKIKSTSIKTSPSFAFWAFCILLAALVAPVTTVASNAGFSGGVTPSRFEVVAKSGDTVRRTVKIYNLGERPAKFQIATSDWTYSDSGQISYSKPLLEGSCRDWVRLESREIEVVPNPRQPRNFRFEVHVPEDAEPRECRFALMVESVASAYIAEFEQAGIKMPVTGRIAVIVYLAIGGVTPEIAVEDMEVRTVNGRRVPVLKVSNRGTAHGRLDSDMTGRDKTGQPRPLAIATSPIMPGQTRYMVVSPLENTDPIAYPLSVQGKIYAPGNTFSIDSVLNDP